GMKRDQLADMKSKLSSLPEAERAALTFARKMSVAAHTVTDEEMESLIRLYGEKKTTAMVLLMAYANFQDRLLLSLGITPDIEAPLPPLAIHFFRGPQSKPLIPLAARLPLENGETAEKTKITLPKGWS